MYFVNQIVRRDDMKSKRSRWATLFQPVVTPKVKKNLYYKESWLIVGYPTPEELTKVEERAQESVFLYAVPNFQAPKKVLEYIQSLGIQEVVVHIFGPGEHQSKDFIKSWSTYCTKYKLIVNDHR
jgi:hypothetical protein